MEVEGEGLVEGDADGAGLIRGGGGVDGGGDEGDDVADGVVVDAFDGGFNGGAGEVGEAAEGPFFTDGEGGDGFDDEGVGDDLGVGWGGLGVAEVLLGEAVLPGVLVVVAAGEVAPGGLAGAGGDDLGSLVFGFGTDELEEGCGGGGIDGVVEEKEDAAGAGGADSLGAGNGEGLGGEGLEFFGRDGGAVG